MGSSFSVDIKQIRKYLKHNFSGPDAVNALRQRTMVHWLYPEIDPLSRQTLGAYEKISELLNIPSNFNMLDVGCMCGFLKHYLDQRIKYNFGYVGIDRWPEAIDVAKEFLPKDNFLVRDFVTEEIEGSFDYVVMANILFKENLTEIFRKSIMLSRKAFIFSIPVHGENLTQTGILRTENIIVALLSCANILGFKAEQFECGESVLIKVNK